MIDEQIEMWRNLNELEKQKEQLIADAHARVESDGDKHQLSNNDDTRINEAESDDDELNEFDAFGLDWRSRKI